MCYPHTWGPDKNVGLTKVPENSVFFSDSKIVYHLAIYFSCFGPNVSNVFMNPSLSNVMV